MQILSKSMYPSCSRYWGSKTEQHIHFPSLKQIFTNLNFMNRIFLCVRSHVTLGGRVLLLFPRRARGGAKLMEIDKGHERICMSTRAPDGRKRNRRWDGNWRGALLYLSHPNSTSSSTFSSSSCSFPSSCLTPPALSHIYIIHLHNTLWCPASSYPLSSAPSNPITTNPNLRSTSQPTDQPPRRRLQPPASPP